MNLYELHYEAAGYLNIHVIGTSNEDVLERFAAAVRAKCKKSGGTWAEDAIEEVRGKSITLINLIGPGVMIDFEPFYA